MSEQAQKPVIGITLGDYNGIGPEVILKALHGNQLNKHFTPVVYGSMRVLNRYKHLYDMKDWQLHPAPAADQLNTKMVNVITCFDDSQTNVEPGNVVPEAGQAAYQSLAKAVEDLKAGHLAALVTAPINKYNIQSEEFKFPGHTEYLAEAFNSSEYLMFMVSERLKVGVVTGHVPLGRVRSNINQDAVSRKLTQIIKSLKEDFGIQKPRVAVLGLNPHAGEDGLLGNEEKEVITPVIDQFRKKNHLVYGPFPADGFFGANSWKKFDAILAMYHDQGLMPFKMLAFEDGVNFTAGLPIVRTSPDHGTAYDIAGKNVADPSSMLHALYSALDIVRHRTEWESLEAQGLEHQNSAAMTELPVTDERDPRTETSTRSQERPAKEERSNREDRPNRDERQPREERAAREDRPNREDRSNRENRPPREDRRPTAAPAATDLPASDPVAEQPLQPKTEEQRTNERPRREDRQNRNNRPQREERQQRPDRRENQNQRPPQEVSADATPSSSEEQRPNERPRREDRQNRNNNPRFQRDERQPRPDRRENQNQRPKTDAESEPSENREAQIKLLAISQSLLIAKTPPTNAKPDENPEA